jgi:hypothetical protein
MKIERVWYQVDWAKFRKGHSFFVPCIDVEEAKYEVLRVTGRLEIDVIMKVVVEDGVKGLRVWRA